MTDPVEHVPLPAPQVPFTAQAALVKEHGALVPPPEPLHVHVRVVPHDVKPLSDAAVPAVHAPAVALHDPLIAAWQSCAAGTVNPPSTAVGVDRFVIVPSPRPPANALLPEHFRAPEL